MIEHESNRGYGGALISGFGAATKEWIFYTDGDAQYDASEVTKLIDAARADTDIVQGWKLSRGDTWYRKVIGRVYHHTVKFLFRLNVADTDCDFRLFRRSLIVERPLQSTSGVICVEMMRQFERAGANFVEVPGPPLRTSLRALAVLPATGDRALGAAAARPLVAAHGPPPELIYRGLAM